MNSPLDNPNFVQWFGKSKVKDSHGKPRVVYHGGFSNFTHFDLAKTNQENQWGQGFYFTSSKVDVNHNYASLKGPDITNKIEQALDTVRDEMSDDELEDIVDNYAYSRGIVLPPQGWNHTFELDALKDYLRTHPEILQYAPTKVNLDSEGSVMPCYLRMLNPCYIGFGDKDTFFDFHEDYNEETEEYGEASGLAVDAIEAFRSITEEDDYRELIK